jgi:hypothetical protein
MRDWRERERAECLNNNYTSEATVKKKTLALTKTHQLKFEITLVFGKTIH